MSKSTELLSDAVYDATDYIVRLVRAYRLD